MSTLAAPTNIILQTGNGQNFLTWNQVSGATGYSIQRGTDGVNWLNTYAPSGVNAYYLDSTAVVGTTYFYQVATVNGSGTGSYSGSYPLSITPCLPGEINLGYLRYMSQLRADKLNSQYLTTDEWNFNINQSSFALYDVLVSKYGDDYFLAPTLQISLTGNDYYALPNGSNYSGAPRLYKLTGVDGNYGGAWKPLARFNWSDRDKYTIWGGNPAVFFGYFDMAYREMGDNLYIIPPNMSMQIRMFYVPVMIQLLQDSDMLPFSISGWSEYIINDAAMKAMVKEESLEKWNALSAINAQILERIEVMAANRDVGQPNSVSNTRATMGDPGFSNWGNGTGSGGWFNGGGF